MDINNGFITLERKIFKWEWYTELTTCRLFIHLLLKVNHSDNNWRGIMVKRGSTVTSLNTLSLETGLSIQQIRTALNKLEKTGEITDKPTKRNRTINVLKYNDYQQVNKQSTQKQHKNNKQDNKQSTTNNNDNNDINNDNNDNIKPKTPYTSFLKTWNNLFPNHQIRSTTDSRKKHIKARIDESSIEEFNNMIKIASESTFLNDWNYFKFDWCIKNATNYNKILEGNYNNKIKTRKVTNDNPLNLPG